MRHVYYIFVLAFATQNVGLGNTNFAVNLSAGDKRIKEKRKQLQRNYYPGS